MLLTEEQRNVVDAAQKGKNVVVKACAGSGKSTTIREIVKSMKHACLFLTYNKELQLETGAHIKAPHEVLTFHALAGRVFARTIPNDSAMHFALENSVNSGEYITPITVIIDEAQDMKEIFIRLINLIVDESTQIIILGDDDQLINDFDADFSAVEGFISSPSLGAREWLHLTLSQSFRLNKNVATFVNAVCGSRICGMRDCDGASSGLVHVDLESTRIIEEIEHAADHGSVFILASKRKGNRKLRAIVNELKERGNRVVVDKVDVPDAKARIKVSSFHSSKGREADTVFILGVIETPTPTAARPLHVALTRAKKNMYILMRGGGKQRLDISHLLMDTNKPDWLHADSKMLASAENRVINSLKSDEEEEVNQTTQPRRRDLTHFSPLGGDWRLDTCFWASEVDYPDNCYVPTKTLDEETRFFLGIDLSHVYSFAAEMAAELYHTGDIARLRYILDPTGEMRRVEIDPQRKLLPGARENDLLPSSVRAAISTWTIPERGCSWRLVAAWACVCLSFDSWNRSYLKLCTCTDKWLQEDVLEQYFLCLRQAIGGGKTTYDICVSEFNETKTCILQTRIFCLKDDKEMAYASVNGADQLSSLRDIAHKLVPLAISKRIKKVRVIDVETSKCILVRLNKIEEEPKHQELLGLI